MVDSEVVNTLDKNGDENDDISSESDSEEMMLDMDVQVNSCTLTSVRTETVRKDSSLDTFIDEGCKCPCCCSQTEQGC